jgi:hypothetical protein
VSDWRVDLIATDNDNVCYGLACESGSKLVHIHQDADGLWIVRHMVAQQMVLHGSYSQFLAAVAAAELL